MSRYVRYLALFSGTQYTSGSNLATGTTTSLSEILPYPRTLMLSKVRPQIAAFALTNGLTTSPTTSNATSSVTPTGNRLQLLIVRSFKSGGAVAPSSVTGNGLTWVNVVNSGGYGPSGNNGIFLYRALGASPSSGAVTINFASSPGDISWQLTEFSNIDLSGTNGSGAIVQSNSAVDAGSGGTSSSVTLSAFGDISNNATYAAVAQNANQTATTNQTNLIFTSAAAGNGGMADAWQTARNSPITFSFTSARWGTVAVEIKAVS